MEITKEANPKLVSQESLVCHCIGLSSSDDSNTRLMRLNNTARISAGFQVPIKAEISPLKLEGSKSSPSFLLAATINSLIYLLLKLFWRDFLILLLSFLELRNSLSKLTSLGVFERVFFFFWSSVNLSIGLSRETNLLDFSVILKNIS